MLDVLARIQCIIFMGDECVQEHICPHRNRNSFFLSISPFQPGIFKAVINCQHFLPKLKNRTQILHTYTLYISLFVSGTSGYVSLCACEHVPPWISMLWNFKLANGGKLSLTSKQVRIYFRTEWVSHSVYKYQFTSRYYSDVFFVFQLYISLHLLCCPEFLVELMDQRISMEDYCNICMKA